MFSASVLMLVLQVSTAGEPLFLTCEADVQAMQETQRATASVSDNDGKNVQGRVTGSELATYHAVIDFELTGIEARVRMPPEMLDIGSAQRGGWIVLRDLKVSDVEIQGTAKTGLFRKSHIHIDRVTGLMTTENGFRAPCQRIDRSQRAF